MTSVADHEKVDTPCRHWWTVHAFHRLSEAGILHEDARVELIEGELVDMAPIGSRHAGTLEKLRYWLERSVQDSALVFSQNPVVLGEHSEPQPDIVLLKPRADFYVHAHPGTADVLLLIEVADSSAEYDRTVKVPLYARHNIPEVWLVDLTATRIEAYRVPRPEYGEYEQLMQVRDGAIAPHALPQVTVDVGKLFGA
jgi:Uma2 family endonuclease